MANFCKNCGAKLSPEQLFCAECGTKIASAASEAAAASEQPVQQEQPVQAELSAAKPEKPQKKQAEKTKEASGGVPAVPVGAAISPGAVLAAALLCVECLPYLLKSLMFLAKKGSLSIFAVQFCGVLGYIAAFAAVILGAKLITGKWRFSYALFFTALLASVRAADKLFLPNASFRHDLFGIFCLASDALARFLCAVFLVSVLRKLFSDKNRAQGGVIGAFILCSLSLLSTEFTNIIWRILPLDIASPMGTFAYKISACFISAGFLALAAKRLLKKQKEKKPKDISSGLTVSGLLAVVLLAFSAFVMKTDIIKQSAYECAANDVERCIARAEGVETIGDMDAALASYKEAGEHLAAWKTVAEGEVYNVPSQYCNDDILQYLSYINRDKDSIKTHVLTAFDETDADMWAPLMLHTYDNDENKPDADEKEHIKELLNICIANEIFIFPYPFKEDIEKDKEDIANALELSEKYDEALKTAEVFAEMQRGGWSASYAVTKLLDVAEEYPESIKLQLLAGYMGTENTWDNASHYARTSEALLRCRDLWLENYKDNSTEAEVLELNKNIASMLLKIKDYENAVPLLEDAYKTASDDGEVVQMLANCYSMTDNAEKGFELTKKLYSGDTDDISVIFSYFEGALKNGEQKEAAQALSKLADTVLKDPNDNADHRDEILFSAVLYFSLNDSSYWTDYTYRIYDDEDTDEEVLKVLEGNEFLYNYVRAVYWEKEKKDPEKALPYAKKALSAMENSGRLHYLNGMILYDSEKFKEALEEYKKADALEPDDPSILFALANTYDALEDYKTAYIYCDKALAHFPNGTDHGADRYGVSAHADNLRGRLRQYVEEAD